MHASICPRKVDRKANFRNRKGTLSLNVMAMCGPNYIFDFVCCAFPGSCHDSFIEKNSELHVEYEVKKNLPFPDALVLGDCAYCRSYKWLCTPLLEGTLGDDPARILFNKCICACRSCIERAFGQIQSVFRILGNKGPIKFPELKICALFIQCLFAIFNFFKRNSAFDDVTEWLEDESSDDDDDDDAAAMPDPIVELEPGQEATNEKFLNKYFK